MKLGSLYLKNNLILAPMQNVTTATFRRFCRNFSDIGLVCAPMLYIKRIQSSPKSAEMELHKIEQERPISIQLIGNEEDALKDAILFLESYDFDVCDFNAGCPSKRAINGKYGGYLLKDLDKLSSLMSIMTKYCSKPVSLKIRTGFQKELDIKKLTALIDQWNIDFITVHGRTVKDRLEKSTINLSFINRLKDSIDISIIGNGDIFKPSSAQEFLEETNVDALMIGRGSMGNPEIFNQITEYLKDNKEVSNLNNKNLLMFYINRYEQILDKYLDEIDFSYSKDEFRFIELKRNAIWFTKNLKNSTDLRRQLNSTRNYKALKQVLEEIYANTN